MKNSGKVTTQKARRNLGNLCATVIANQNHIVIKGAKGDDVVLMPASELFELLALAGGPTQSNVKKRHRRPS